MLPRLTISTAFYATPFEQRGSGAALISAKKFGPWTSRHMTINTGTTVGNGFGTSRHILDMATTFYPYSDEGDLPGTELKTIEEHMVAAPGSKCLRKLFPTAHLYCRRGDYNKWLALHKHKARVVGAGGVIGGAAQGIVTFVKGAGLVKYVTGTCIAVGTGAGAAVVVGGAAGYGVVCVAGIRADNIFLFDAGGRVSPHEQHVAELKKQYKWVVETPLT
jgi:hypothetical protein